MKPINKSVSKLVFLIMAVTICLAFIFEIFMGKITLESKDFIGLVGMAFVYYFTRNNTNSDSVSSDEISKKVLINDQKGVD